jgi:HEAT repeat protein
MRTSKWARTLTIASAAVALIAVGCHADPNDAAGQAGELSDPVRRENAITNLDRIYHTALDNAGGDRTAAGPVGVADLCVTQLNDAYLAYPEDVSNGERIMNLLGEMRDVRSLPALTKALDWRPEVSEEHAVTSANTIRFLTLTDAQKGEVIDAVASALRRVTQNRGVDNRMRQAFIRALVSTRDPRAAAPIRDVMMLQSDSQPFLINRFAAEQLGELEDAESIPALIQALYLFDPNNPAMRMNDVAAGALVRIGRAAIEPLVATLRGENTEANQIATRYIEAVRTRAAEAAANMDRGAIVSNEAAYTLGQLGFVEAIDPLVAEATSLDEGERTDSVEEDRADLVRQFGAALALVSINRRDTDTPRIRQTLMTVFNRIPPGIDPTRPNRTQLLVAMQHFMDPELLPFLLGLSRPPARGADEDPDMRVLAFRAYLMVASGSEMAALREMYNAEPEGDTRDGFNQFDPEPIFAAATDCNEDAACWARKLSDTNQSVVQKAAYMVARYGRGDATAITALVGALGNRDESSIGEILYALDHVSLHGSPEAVTRIEEMRDSGGGTSFWNHISSLALAVHARLQARAEGTGS